MSISVASNSAEDRPQIMPPIYWLCAATGLMMVPAANAPTMRGTRTSQVRLCTRTSTNCAP